MKYDFTGKERDNQTTYDYFGARYYDSRIGRWGGVEPLLDKYPGFTAYCYSLNNPIISKDVNGLDVVVVFSGWGQQVGGEIIDPSSYSNNSETGSNVLLYDLQKFSQEAGLQDFDMRGYYSSFEGKEIFDAYDYVVSNLDNQDEKVILYGYSLGGYNINDLATMLGDQGYNVSLMVTSDAYSGSPLFEGIEVPENVETNVNIYQTDRSIVGSRGFPSKALSEKTNLINIKVESIKHKEMDEKTNRFAEKIIENELLYK
jgi:RHS repeat-associated protein